MSTSAVSLTRYSQALEPPPDEGQLMKNRNRQSGVVEWILIAVLAMSMGTYIIRSEQGHNAERQHQQQQIDNIKSGGVNDGRVDW